MNKLHWCCIVSIAFVIKQQKCLYKIKVIIIYVVHKGKNQAKIIDFNFSTISVTFHKYKQELKMSVSVNKGDIKIYAALNNG